METTSTAILRKAPKRTSQLAAPQALALILLLYSFLSATASDLSTASVTVAWDPSPSEGVVGYVVYVGAESRTYTRSIPVGSETSCVITNLTRGITHYIAVTAIDSTGLESDFSEELVYTPPLIMAPSVSLSIGEAGQMNLSATGIGSIQYEVLASQDMLYWTNLATLTADPDGAMRFTDEQAGNFPHRFYKLLQVQTP